jgi:hypothetical protein
MIEKKEIGVFEHEVIQVLDSLKELLVMKNRKYGDAALTPTRIFSKQNNIEQIKVRIDDKLSRLRSSQSDEDEDVEQDLMGYLVLLQIAKKRNLKSNPKSEEASDFWVKKLTE